MDGAAGGVDHQTLIPIHRQGGEELAIRRPGQPTCCNQGVFVQQAPGCLASQMRNAPLSLLLSVEARNRPSGDQATAILRWPSATAVCRSDL